MTEDLMALLGFGSSPEPDRFLVIGYGNEPGTLLVLSAQGTFGVLEQRRVIKTHSFSN